MIQNYKNINAKRLAEQDREISELRGALVELAGIISEEGEKNG